MFISSKGWVNGVSQFVHHTLNYFHNPKDLLKNILIKNFLILLQDPSTVPLPGGTVYVHKKACRFERAKTPTSSSVHKHVRRFMLTKETELWARGRGSTPAATEITY